MEAIIRVTKAFWGIRFGALLLQEARRSRRPRACYISENSPVPAMASRISMDGAANVPDSLGSSPSESLDTSGAYRLSMTFGFRLHLSALNETKSAFVDW